MNAILDTIFPVFAIVLCGYLAGRAGVLGEDSTRAINRFVFYVAMPALLFEAMARLEPADIFHLPFILTYAGAQGVVFVFGLGLALFVFREPLTESAIHGMAGVYGNIGYLGIPIFFTAFGPKWAIVPVIAIVLNISIVVTTTIVLIELGLERGGKKTRMGKDIAVSLLANPLFLSPLLGIAWAFTGLGLAPPIETFTHLLGGAAGPAALFSLGLFMVGKPLHQDITEVSSMIVAKLVLMPLAAWALGRWLMPGDPEWAMMAVLLAAMPSGTNFYIIAGNYGRYVRRSSSAILVSTAASALTLSVLFALYAD